MKYISVLLILLSILPLTSALTTDAPVYLPGEIINIQGAQQLDVFTPSSSYTLLGTQKNISFPATEIGTYIFRDNEMQQAIRVLLPETLTLRTAKGAATIQGGRDGEYVYVKQPNMRVRIKGNPTEIRLSAEITPKWGFVKTYAIDPTTPGFEEAELTRTADGNSLYKCAEYNYTEQTCYGSWQFVQTLTPGEEYTILVSGSDPVYGEGSSQSQPDQCRFSDDTGAGDADTNVDCLSEIQTRNDGITADLEDPEQGGGPSNIEVNFTNTFSVASINSVSVTTRYQRAINTQVADTTATIQVWSGGAWTTACTDTVVLVGGWENVTCNLASWITNQAQANDVRMRLQFDTGKIGKGDSFGLVYVDFMYLAIDFVYNDIFAPTYSTITASAATPKIYDGLASNFSSNWSDDVGVATVLIEHNFTGTLQNTTVSGSGPQYTHQQTLGAGTYQWRMLANDSAGNRNNTMPYQTYIVTQATGNVQLLVNGSASNLTMDEDYTITLNASRLAGETSMTLYENGVSIGSGTTINMLRTYNTPGVYVLDLNMTSTQNYTFANKRFYVTVLDKTPPATITSLVNTSADINWILWNWTNPVDSDFSHTIVEINGSWFANVSTPYYNATGLSADTEYEIQLRTVDTNNNINQTTITDLARTILSVDVTSPQITNILNSSVTDSSATITWDTDEIADSVVKYGTSTGTYTLVASDAADITSHSIALTALSPSTTYYYVVNSTDPSENSNQSTEYTFTTSSDMTPPTYTGIIATPSSPQVYPATITFNVTWSDYGAMDAVLFEHNISGVFVNETVSGTSIYSITKNPRATTFSWRMIANDSAGNTNNTMPYQTYTITKGTGLVNLTINNTDADISIDEDTNAVLNATRVVGEGVLELLQDGTLLQSGYGTQLLTKNFTAPGLYTIIARLNATENYTAHQESHTVYVRDTTPPNVSLVLPLQGKTITGADVTFSALPQDNNDTASCSLYLNGVWNQTNSSVTDGAYVYFFQTFINGAYNWSVSCIDTAGNTRMTTNRTFTISIINPWIPTTATHNVDGVVTGDVNVSGGTARRIDNGEYVEVTTWSSTAPANANITALEASCEIDLAERGFEVAFQYNTGGGWSGNQCASPQDTGGTFSCNLYALGVDTVSELNNLDVRCIALDVNGGSGSRGDLDYMQLQPDWTLIQLPDFSVTASNITIPSNAKESTSILLSANVSNGGALDATTTVQFYDITHGTVIAQPSANVPAGGYTQFNASWSAVIGRTNISVIIDPASVVTEQDETNNNASVFADVSSQQTYYGLTQKRFAFLASGNQQNYNWSNDNLQGNIFATDSDAVISMLNLQALTRDTGGAYAFSDLAELDAHLGMTNWTDNINSTYASSGTLKQTQTFTIFGQTIPNVPVINSTTTSAFVTGILYDVDDDTNGGYDGEEDIVFVTRINISQLGAYGTYDYELTIPALLRNNTIGANTVDLFIEVI